MTKKKKSKEPKNLKKWGINFLLAIGVILFLPESSYYRNLQLNWRKPQVFSAHFVLPPLSPIPKVKKSNPIPDLSAKSIIVVDVSSAVVLYQKNVYASLPMASTTKIMTALIALDYYLPQQVIEVSEIFDIGQDMKLQKGEKITVENLLYGLLVGSANDAAEVFAANYPGGRENFISKMNEKARHLHLTHTHFMNPTGIDEFGQYTSAVDLVRLTKDALLNPIFRKIVATKEITVYSVDKKFVHPMSNVNTLLGKIDGFKGVKTGFTDEAGECLVGLVERNGTQIMTVVLGSKDRFGETQQLIDWAFDSFEWITLSI